MKESLSCLAEQVSGQIIGDNEKQITSLSSFSKADANSLVFAEDEQNLKLALESKAGAILTQLDCSNAKNKSLILVSKPRHAFMQLLNRYCNQPLRKPGVHPSAVIADDVKIGENCHIGAFVVIESGTIIGDNCCLLNHVSLGEKVSLGDNVVLHPHTTVYDNCTLGNQVIIHSGSVIGSDGFGYEFIDGKHEKIHHIGNVIIEDNVEIGANSVVDRASLESTVVGQGTKIDNFVQVAHSVELGQNNILCAFTGVAGSSRSGNNVIFAANVGVSDHVIIEDGVILGARTGVPPKKTLKAGLIYLGSPARPKDKAIEVELSSTRIPLMRKQIKTLKQKVGEIEKKLTE